MTNIPSDEELKVIMPNLVKRLDALFKEVDEMIDEVYKLDERMPDHPYTTAYINKCRNWISSIAYSLKEFKYTYEIDNLFDIQAAIEKGKELFLKEKEKQK